MNKKNKYVKLLIIILNIAGVLCLIYFGIPFIKHDMTINNPNSMLSTYTWNSCGSVLTLGLIPLIIANIIAFKFLNIKNKILKLLLFLPSLICLVLVSIYLFISFNEEENNYESELINSFKCALKGKVYIYKIYQEQDETYSIEMSDFDKIPLSIINYESPNDIYNSIEEYYTKNGGMCT